MAVIQALPTGLVGRFFGAFFGNEKAATKVPATSPET
jgi:hypothetical protein